MSVVEHPRPEGLLHNPAFSQVVISWEICTNLHGGAGVDRRARCAGRC